MPLLSRPGGSILGRTVGTAIRGTRLLVRGSAAGGRWVVRRAGRMRAKGAAGEVGMIRLFDLHATSVAGDALVAIGLAGTIFFSVPLGEARSKVALYLLVTMVPFALLAPVVGPLLDHFRHGRRYALATTMLGRAFLAWLISDYINGFGLYPAAFGVLVLSRAYGVARAAAVPRLLPANLGLSQANARGSVYGTLAAAVVTPLGLAAFWFGPQWSLRVASVIFLVGMVVALRLPPRADSEPPETMPRLLTAIGFRRSKDDRPLTGAGRASRVVLATLVGSATLRALYGFLLLFLAFVIKAGDLPTEAFGRELGAEGAIGLVGGALAVGTFLATALGTRLRIHHPAAVQSSGLVIVAGVAVLATLNYSLPMVALLSLVTAIISGIGKLAVDACIQELIHERSRASAFAHSETVLMLAFVAGGAVGLIPFLGRIGIGVAAGFAVVAAVRAVVVASRLPRERLNGRAATDNEMVATAAPATSADTPAATASANSTADPARRSGAADSPPTVRMDSFPADSTVHFTGPVPPATDSHPLASPGFHIYRPSSTMPSPGDGSTHPEPRGSTG